MEKIPLLLAATSFALMLAPAKAALVAHYEFEETSGTTLVDSATNSYDGTVVGNGDLNVSGIIGSAYEPGGNGSYGRVTDGVSNFSIGGNKARTLSFWFKTPSFGGTADQHRMLGLGSSGTATAFNIVAESGTNAGGSNRIGLRYGNGNVYFNADNSGTPFATGTWYHVAVVYDGTTLDLEPIGSSSDSTGLTVYVNGTEVDTAGGNLNNATQALNTSTTDFGFGANADGSQSSYPGLLDEVRIYNSALSASEVATLASEAGSLPQIQSFTASETLVEEGSVVMLSWSASNYDTLVIQPGNIDAAALSTDGSGSTEITVNETTTYTLTASGDKTDLSQSVEIVILGDDLQLLDKVGRSLWTEWYRPVDQPVFSTTDGNNHDPIIFYEPSGSTYKYYLIISHEPSNTFLWGTNTFSWSSDDWTLIEGNYQINGQYEYDDGVKVGDTYYVYENGSVLTYTGDLLNSSGNWTVAGSFPKSEADDIGVYYEDGLFHIFGEHGNFPYGPDGTSLAHYTSTTGIGDWTLVDNKAVDPNPDGGDTYGVGDATIAKIDGIYYLFCDREQQGVPYRVTAWRSTDIDEPFKYLGVALAPRSDETDDWDNHRIQDAEIQYIPELKRFIMVCNMRDLDGDPGPGNTRVVGTFYSKFTDGGFDAFMQGFSRLSGNDVLMSADPDGDGSPNAEEYAAGTLPDNPGSSPAMELMFLEDGELSYPTITFDRITADPQTIRMGLVSNQGSLNVGTFQSADGSESTSEASDIGAFYEKVTFRSNTAVSSSDSQFLRIETTITTSP
ncbi:hypothetical protein DDZ13_05765 [Coraliomargarita sinensis]|uniref:LamG-like jellyroll fold domain-containing protein n=1 Tax=Coraliomargarita sinensis TaxID=2174842 RepID=A0A317ZKG4_9BACT|nr:LamG-like jellyroll fold domain-containing protein [Coraliomargarita sinensis]PXA04677.1 hypothetical protein DDZ13_05765 [Coraliomargarita sinensis]